MGFYDMLAYRGQLYVQRLGSGINNMVVLCIRHILCYNLVSQEKQNVI